MNAIAPVKTARDALAVPRSNGAANPARGRATTEEDGPQDDPTTVVGTFTPGEIPGAAAGAPRGSGAETMPSIGRYRIAREIARGGMGVILKAWDPKFGRYVALKLLHERFRTDDALIRRFHEEACINGRLNHPTIVPIHELGCCANGRPFFSMRLIEGQTLSSLLSRRSDLQSQQAAFLRMFEKICQGVAFAHTQKVIHRDLKPSNILVGDFGVINIMDWGLARYVHSVPSENGSGSRSGADPASLCDPDDTECGQVCGTPAYLPPEQARGDSGCIDERADVFSLGGILCHILTGSGPYVGNAAAKLQQAAEGQLAPAFAQLDNCLAERDIVDLAKRCLCPDPSGRPRDANEVAGTVTGYLESDLRRAERDLIRFFELSLDLFCIAGFDGYFKRINPNFSRLLGYQESELLTLPFTHFIHPDDLAPVAAAMEHLSGGLPLVQFTNRYRHAAGHYLYIEWVAKRETDIAGCIYAVGRDVTNRIQHEITSGQGGFRLHQMEAIAEAVP